MTSKGTKGIIYAAVNPAFKQYVKIGRTRGGLKKRMLELDNTSSPLPFRCEYALEVDDDKKVEKILRDTFHKERVRINREFFKIDIQSVIKTLEAFKGREVTLNEDAVKSDEDAEAMNVGFAESEMRSRRSFTEVGVSVGDVLKYVRDNSITATVTDVEKNKVNFEGEECSLSKAAIILLHKNGFKWKTANGWTWWMKDGQSMEALAKKLEVKTEGEDSLFG